MAKFYGAIGYADRSETSPGVWKNIITERNYSGDVMKNSSRTISDGSVNGNLTFSNTFSIIADPYAVKEFYKMKYIRWLGTPFEIASVDVQRPRIILTIGGVYHGEQAAASN